MIAALVFAPLFAGWVLLHTASMDPEFEWGYVGRAPTVQEIRLRAAVRTMTAQMVVMSERVADALRIANDAAAHYVAMIEQLRREM